MTKRVIEREQSIMGKIFFIFKVNTVEKGPEGPFPLKKTYKSQIYFIHSLTDSQRVASILNL